MPNFGLGINVNNEMKIIRIFLRYSQLYLNFLLELGTSWHYFSSFSQHAHIVLLKNSRSYSNRTLKKDEKVIYNLEQYLADSTLIRTSQICVEGRPKVNDGHHSGRPIKLLCLLPKALSLSWKILPIENHFISPCHTVGWNISGFRIKRRKL